MKENGPPPAEPVSLGKKYAEIWARGWERYLEFARTDGAAAMRKFSEASASYYGAVMTLGMDLSRNFYREVFQNGGADVEVERRRPSGNGELIFAGPIGSAPSRPFLVANNTPNPATIEFELSEFVSDESDEKVRVEAQLTPASFELAPHTQRTVDCAVPLTGEFVPNRDYRAVLRAIGLPEMKVILRVRVDAAANE